MDARPVGSARREKALATRAQIVRAAHEEFLAQGFHGATIAAIARRAGVAVQTIYFVFHTKAELISAAIDAAVLGDDLVSPMESEWWREMTADPDPATALRTFIRGAGPIFERASPIGVILSAAAHGDEEVRKTSDKHDRMQRDDFRAALALIEAKGPFRAGLTLDRATDVLLTLLSDSVYVQLTRGSQWTHQEVVDWWCEAVPMLLLGPPSA